MGTRVVEWVTGCFERALAALGPAPAASSARLTDRPHVAIAEARAGERVRVVGRVLAGERTLRAPLSDRECVFWELSIDHMIATPTRTPADRRAKAWTAVHRAHEVVPFELEDHTDIASVRTESFAGWSVRDARSYGDESIVLDRARVAALLDRLDVDHLLREANVRLREGVFEIGEEIAVDARADWTEIALEPSVGAYRAAARTRRLLLVADPDDPVCASDDPEGPY